MLKGVIMSIARYHQISRYGMWKRRQGSNLYHSKLSIKASQSGSSIHFFAILIWVPFRRLSPHDLHP